MVRTSRGFRPTYVEPAVTADIKTNSGNVCEYWDASCKIQQGMDSINVGVIQAGEDITSWGETTTQWIQGGFVEAGENIQSTYVETIEKPIVQGVEYVQGGFVEAGENIQDAYVKNIETPIVKAGESIVEGATWISDGVVETVTIAGEGATKGITDTLKIAGVAALGLGVLLVMKK